MKPSRQAGRQADRQARRQAGQPASQQASVSQAGRKATHSFTHKLTHLLNRATTHPAGRIHLVIIKQALQVEQGVGGSAAHQVLPVAWEGKNTGQAGRDGINQERRRFGSSQEAR